MDSDGMTTEAGVLEQIEAVVTAAPDDVAVKAPDAMLTYRQLSDRADQLAQELVQLGLRQGDLVGQCVERSAALVVAALGIARAGGAYVAIDTKYPDDRVRWMLDDCNPKAVVTDEPTAARLFAAGARPTLLLREGELVSRTAGDAKPLPGPPRGEDLAYVVYTSGSTGRPKGVMVEHASLLNLVEWHRAAFSLGQEDRCTQIASPGFDATVWEIWPALATGAAIHVVPDELRVDPIALRDWLAAEGVTVSFLPTAVADVMIGLSWPAVTSLRVLLTGGDALARRPAADLPFTVVNNYGLTETAVVATSGVVDPDGEGQPSIGRAIVGATLQIVDESLRPVEPGRDGELLIGGAVLARGYLNRPELTAERFVVDAQGERHYRSGDRARIGPDGEVEFLGRLDDQVSIRGFRVEPGEVTAALGSHPEVGAGVAMARGSSSADRHLVAYLVPSNGRRVADDELAEFLGRFLPDYMVPASYVWIDRLPLNEHGKVDRHALGEVADEREALDQSGPSRAGHPAETETEASVVAIIADLLEVPEVGIDQNFFLLGGHSMLGAQLIARLEELYGAEISLRYLFDHPTAGDLAAEVERQRAAGAAPRPSVELAAG